VYGLDRVSGPPLRRFLQLSPLSFDASTFDIWVPLLRGVTAAYVTYYPDLAFPGAAESIREFARLAVEAGVRRLVLLSGRGEEEAEVSEQGVRESGAEWTVVRSTWFAPSSLVRRPSARKQRSSFTHETSAPSNVPLP